MQYICSNTDCQVDIYYIASIAKRRTHCEIYRKIAYVTQYYDVGGSQFTRIDHSACVAAGIIERRMAYHEIVMARHLTTNVVSVGSRHVVDKNVRRDHLTQVTCHVFVPLKCDEFEITGFV